MGCFGNFTGEDLAMSMSASIVSMKKFLQTVTAAYLQFTALMAHVKVTIFILERHSILFFGMVEVLIHFC